MEGRIEDWAKVISVLKYREDQEEPTGRGVIPYLYVAIVNTNYSVIVLKFSKIDYNNGHN